ncbi:hypothetical protein M3P05_04025 [Sansalvadorimonas sp. 2012CJ34-2]|uniref:Uncharacterized protein n=1 Tax=Parendozoicomonas callyspongiae TaxID=2942213 RepID=A0ABT0PCK7_9GAMM|nr:hypothetical protein [Sansalvadorimonas sp. 2012CJ34-2]MCL6269109.1 hypothetical protein [Sansalvadorimonas sp. 2012CJ34-2]
MGDIALDCIRTGMASLAIRHGEPHSEIQNEDEATSQTLFGRAKRKAEKVSTLRILIQSGGNFGVENASFETLKCWLDIAQPLRVEMIVDEYQAKTISILSPSYEPKKKAKL